jgi:hypothetical protein
MSVTLLGKRKEPEPLTSLPPICLQETSAFGQIPAEVSLLVLSFLSPQDWVAARQVCLLWRNFSADSLLAHMKSLELDVENAPFKRNISPRLYFDFRKAYQWLHKYWHARRTIERIFRMPVKAARLTFRSPQFNSRDFESLFVVQPNSSGEESIHPEKSLQRLSQLHPLTVAKLFRHVWCYLWKGNVRTLHRHTQLTPSQVCFAFDTFLRFTRCRKVWEVTLYQKKTLFNATFSSIQTGQAGLFKYIFHASSLSPSYDHLTHASAHCQVKIIRYILQKGTITDVRRLSALTYCGIQITAPPSNEISKVIQLLLPAAPYRLNDKAVTNGLLLQAEKGTLEVFRLFFNPRFLFIRDQNNRTLMELNAGGDRRISHFLMQQIPFPSTGS